MMRTNGVLEVGRRIPLEGEHALPEEDVVLDAVVGKGRRTSRPDRRWPGDCLSDRRGESRSLASTRARPGTEPQLPDLKELGRALPNSSKSGTNLKGLPSRPRTEPRIHSRPRACALTIQHSAALRPWKGCIWRDW
jgi:hypothetical protein